MFLNASLAAAAMLAIVSPALAAPPAAISNVPCGRCHEEIFPFLTWEDYNPVGENKNWTVSTIKPQIRNYTIFRYERDKGRIRKFYVYHPGSSPSDQDDPRFYLPAKGKNPHWLLSE